MTLLPQVRRQLLDAAFDVTHPGGVQAHGRRTGRLAISLSAAVCVAVAALFVLNLERASAPAPPPGAAPVAGPPPQPWVEALGRAAELTGRRDPACRAPRQAPSRDQRFLTTAPPRSITDILPTLKSPAPAALRVTAGQLRALHLFANGIYVRYAWQRYTHGIHVYVVPAALVGATTELPRRCDREELTAFRTRVRRLPAWQRHAAIAYAQRLLSQSAEVGVTVRTSGGGGTGEDSYPVWMLAEEGWSRASFGAVSGGSDYSTTTSVLVSDRVASVTATYSAQSHPGRVRRTFSITERPFRNLVVFQLTGAWDPPKLTYRSRAGAVISQTGRRG